MDAVFKHKECVDIILDSWRFLQSEGSLRLHAYVVMEDHLHLVASGDNLSNTMRRFLSHTARQIIDHFTKHDPEDYLTVFRAHCPINQGTAVHKVWRGDYHPQGIVSEYMYDQKVKYIHQNPVRKGLVHSADDWPYSSLAYRNGQPNLPPIHPVRIPAVLAGSARPDRRLEYT